MDNAVAIGLFVVAPILFLAIVILGFLRVRRSRRKMQAMEPSERRHLFAELPPEETARLLVMIRDGNRIQAVQEVMRLTDADMSEAKNVVDALEAEPTQEEIDRLREN